MAAQSRNIAELENASVWRLLVQYSLPSIAGMVVYSLYNIIDSVFIGHGVGPLALSGLAVTFPIMNLTFALGTLVGIGGAAISSIRLGKKDQEGTERTLGNVLIMSLIAAVVLVVPTLLFLTEILTAFGASGQTLAYAYDFMLVTLLGLPVTYVFFNLNHVMRATGYPKKAMGSTLLSVGINIILAPIFIFWFKWGITGAALATLLAQVTGMARVLLHFSDAASTVHFRRGIWELRKAIVTGILSIGMAPCLVNVCGSAVTIAINRQLADHGGDLAIGAYGIINRILILFAMLVIGLTQGMQPIIGYNHGAMKPGRVLLTLKYGVLAGTSFTTLAVTFVDNHDSQWGSSLESAVEDWFKPSAYALILLMKEGYPCIFYGDYYGVSGNPPMHRGIIDNLLEIRKNHAFGEQNYYFDHPNTIGFTRVGNDDHPHSGVAVLISNGEDGDKVMNVGKQHAGETWKEATGNVEETVAIDEEGNGQFLVHGGNVAVWIPENAPQDPKQDARVEDEE